MSLIFTDYSSTALKCLCKSTFLQKKSNLISNEPMTKCNRTSEVYSLLPFSRVYDKTFICVNSY